MKSFVLPLFFLSIHISFCQCPLLGEWCLVPNCNSKLIFHKDGKFEYALNSNLVTLLGSGELKFYAERINGENWIRVSKQSNTPFLHFKYEIDDCNLLVVFYKSGNNIDHDIDEIGWYRKSGCDANLSKPAHTQTFIVPDYFQGEAYIIYAGDKIRNEKSITFNFHPSGVQNLSFKAEPLDLLRCNSHDFI